MDKLKEVYRERLLNKHNKPIGWLDKDMELGKQMKNLEKGIDNKFLDELFEEAKKEALEIINLS